MKKRNRPRCSLDISSCVTQTFRSDISTPDSLPARHYVRLLECSCNRITKSIWKRSYINLDARCYCLGVRIIPRIMSLNYTLSPVDFILVALHGQSTRWILLYLVVVRFSKSLVNLQLISSQLVVETNAREGRQEDCRLFWRENTRGNRFTRSRTNTKAEEYHSRRLGRFPTLPSGIP